MSHLTDVLVLVEDKVHMIREKTGTPKNTAKGLEPHTYYAKCGYHERQEGPKPDSFTVWVHEVTCQSCKGE